MSASKQKVISEYYDFQQEAIDKIIECYKNNPIARVLLVSPTGTGKTVSTNGTLIDDRLNDVLLKNKTRKTLRVIFKSHMYRLLTQAKRTFDLSKCKEVKIKEWIDNPHVDTSDYKVEIVYQTYSEKIPVDLDADMVIWEEVHHEACKTAQEFLEFGGRLPSLGLTATPERNDNCLIKFDKIIESISRRQAVERGFICETDLYTIVDTYGKNKEQLIKDVIFEYNHLMDQTLVFTRTNKECRILEEYINSLDIGLAIDVSKSSPEELDVILDEFANRTYRWVINCKKLSEGIDIAGCTDVLIARNVGSGIDLNQIIGRASRIDVRECRCWEFVNPMSGNNIDSLEIIGVAKSHTLISKKNGKFITRDFQDKSI